eukprot:11881030-Alexandrium_andersonii.AAC.1
MGPCAPGRFRWWFEAEQPAIQSGTFIGLHSPTGHFSSGVECAATNAGNCTRSDKPAYNIIMQEYAA